MRIMYVITRAEFGGAQSHVAALLQSAIQRGETVALVIGEEGPLTERARQMGAAVFVARHLTQPIRPGKDIQALMEIWSTIRMFRPHIVHLHSSKAGVLGRLAGMLSGVPRVFTAHGWAFSEGVPVVRKFVALATERIASRWADKIITVSDYDRCLALRERVANSKQLVTIHNGVEDKPERADPSSSSGSVVVTMVARFAVPKDYQCLVSAAQGLKGDFRLRFVGDGPDLPVIRAQVKAAGLSERTDFLGSRSDVSELLSKTHVFALASKWEGLPISILEAMRAGLPVVASDAGGVREAVLDGKTGFLVSIGDVEFLRHRIQCLLDSPELRTEYGYAGRDRYERQFTLDRMLAETWRVYDSLNKGHSMNSGACAGEIGRSR